MRLKNISLRTTLKKLEKVFRAKDHLADGLHIIDFEQLKSENSTLKSKAEERNKDLIKLDKTKTTDMKVFRCISFIFYFIILTSFHFSYNHIISIFFFSF